MAEDQNLGLEGAQRILAEAEREMAERATRWETEGAEIAAKIGEREPILMVDEAAEYISRPAPRKRPTGPSKPGSAFGL